MGKPNVIVIAADDLGYGDIAAFSGSPAVTPALDQWMAEGVALTQYYSAAPVCTPSRAGLLTGRYPHRTGAIDMREIRGLSRLALRERTMADVFRTNGYTTGMVGKWHLGTVGEAYHPNARGFGEFVGFRGGLSDYYNWNLYYNAEIRPSDGRYITDVFTAEAVDFIARQEAEPFFLHVAYTAPHVPIQVPEEEAQPFLDTGEYTSGVSQLYGMIRRMDRGIAAILEQLRSSGLEEQTIVVFVSDHGPDLGGTGEMRMARYNAGLSGEKNTVYEGGIRVPCLIRWPGQLEPGRKFAGMVHAIDWLPTLIEAAGLTWTPPLLLDGSSRWGALTGRESEAAYESECVRFWQWNRYTPVAECNAAMREGPWKLVRPPIQEAMEADKSEFMLDRMVEKNPEYYPDIQRDMPEPVRQIPSPPPAQLFKLDEDPGERVDLAGRYPQRVTRMLEELDAWFRSVESERLSSS